MAATLVAVVSLFLSASASVLVPPPATSKSAAASVVAVVPQTIPSSQYHSQDEYGQYSYGYSNSDGQSKAEVKGIDGSVAGKYSYVDGSGRRIEVSYIADDSGFHAVGDHLPSNNVPLVPEPLAKAYEEANTRLKEAYARDLMMAAATKGKEAEEEEEKKGKEEEEEEEEEDGKKKDEEESEEDSGESEKKKNGKKKDEEEEQVPVASYSNVAAQQALQVQPVVGVGSPVAAIQASAPAPQVVYVARPVVGPTFISQQQSVGQYVRAAAAAATPVRATLPAVTVPQAAATTYQLVQQQQSSLPSSAIRLTNQSFRTYGSTNQQQDSLSSSKPVQVNTVPVAIQRFTTTQSVATQSHHFSLPQFAIPGYGTYIPAQFSSAAASGRR